MSFEISNHSARIISKRAVVNHLASTFEKNKIVEMLKKNSTRLVNRAEDGLARVCELSQKPHHIKCRVRVKSRSRLSGWR